MIRHVKNMHDPPHDHQTIMHTVSDRQLEALEAGERHRNDAGASSTTDTDANYADVADQSPVASGSTSLATAVATLPQISVIVPDATAAPAVDPANARSVIQFAPAAASALSPVRRAQLSPYRDRLPPSAPPPDKMRRLSRSGGGGGGTGQDDTDNSNSDVVASAPVPGVHVWTTAMHVSNADAADAGPSGCVRRTELPQSPSNVRSRIELPQPVESTPLSSAAMLPQVVESMAIDAGADGGGRRVTYEQPLRPTRYENVVTYRENPPAKMEPVHATAGRSATQQSDGDPAALG